MPETTISSIRFSTDQQAMDAIHWLKANHPDAYATILADFPELATAPEPDSWFDTEAMGVDIEWGSWLVDAIENTGLVHWEHGEPWIDVPE